MCMPKVWKNSVKKAEIQRDRNDGIRAEARNATINDIHEQWLQLKKGLKANTLVNYEYMYKMYVFPEFGQRKVGSLKNQTCGGFTMVLLILSG